MSKLLVVTRSDSRIKEMTDITHPIIKKFAEKWGAEFRIFEEREWPVHPRHYRIMELGELLNVYDRALCIDSDVIITPNCDKNPFEVVPESKIGTVLEDVGSRQGRRRELIRKVQSQYGNVGWEQGYINTGFFVVSKRHKDIFQSINATDYWGGFGFDDVTLGYQIHAKKHEIYDLHYKWNFTTMFSEKWCGGNRFKAFVIHYAGNGIFEDGVKNRLEQIKKDYGVIYGKSGL